MTTKQETETGTIDRDDEVARKDWERSYLRAGKILKLVPGGYEVYWPEQNVITYENDDTIELRYPED